MSLLSSNTATISDDGTMMSALEKFFLLLSCIRTHGRADAWTGAWTDGRTIFIRFESDS